MTSRRPDPPWILAAAAVTALLVGMLAWILSEAGEPAAVPPLPAEPAVAVGAPRMSQALPDPPERRPPPSAGEPAAPSSLAPEPPRLGPAAVVGRVIDATSGEPVAAFEVRVLDHADRSPLLALDSVPPQLFRARSGVFRIPKIPGTWDVVVTAPGYQPTFQSGVITPALGLDPIEFALRRGSSITGRVHDERGAGVADVSVFLHVSQLFDPTEPAPRRTIVSTDADGAFRFAPLPLGDYAISVRELDNPVDRVEGLRVYSGEATQVEVFLHPRHSLQLTFQDVYGRPLRSVEVELLGPSHYASGESDDAGRVLLEHLPDGEYTVRTRVAGHVDLEETLELYGGSGRQARRLTLEIAPEG